MSTVSKPLPLPHADVALGEKQELLTIWHSVNDWYGEAVSPTGPYHGDGFEHFAGAILLGLKYLVGELRSWLRTLPDQQKKTVARTAKAAADALKWVQLQPSVDKLVAEFKSSLGITVFCATVDYDMLFPVEQNFFSGAKLQQVTLPDSAGQLRRCLAMWQLVQLYTRKNPDPKMITGKVITQKLKDLQKQIEVQLPGASQESRAKRSRPNTPDRGRSKTPPGRSSPPVGNKVAEIMAKLTVNQAEKDAYLARYDRNVGLVPLEGLAKSPVPISAENMLTLAQGAWLDDYIIDGYLSLVCHEANGHFGPGGQKLPQSPKWHAWSCRWLTDNDDSKPWPPPAYLEAKVQDITHHLFPRHMEDHWILFHLWVDEQNKWRAEFLSSLRGYTRAIEDQWPMIKGMVLSIATGEMDLDTIEMEIPGSQPIQRNVHDCGIFLLCAARWRYQGWPLGSLQPAHCPRLRERIIVELEKWRLG